MKSKTASEPGGPEPRRFYLPPDAIGRQDVVTFPESESLHILSSLRMGKGDTVTATDGRGTICKVRLEQVGERRVKGRIVGVTKADQVEPTIHVFLGVVKSARMDLLVEKCTELGVAGFTPVYMKRSVRRISDPRLGRLRRIAIEAMKQSLGAHLPDIRMPMAFEDAVSDLTESGLNDFDLVLAAWEGELERTLEDVPAVSPSSRIALWIGPEGGFTDAEISTLIEKGALTFTLGHLRLKTETAAIVSVATLHHILYRGPSGK